MCAGLWISRVMITHIISRVRASASEIELTGRYRHYTDLSLVFLLRLTPPSTQNTNRELKKKKKNDLKRKMRLKRQGEQTNVCSCTVGFSFSFLFVHPTDLTDQIGSSADPVSVPPYKLYSINFLLVNYLALSTRSHDPKNNLDVVRFFFFL